MRKVRGFTLIELMVVVLIVSVLAGLAFSAYNNQVRKSRRADAKQALSDLSLRQEKYRSNNTTYGTVVEIGGAPPATYYTIALTAGSDTAIGYIFTATPIGDQLKDSCGTLTLEMDAGTLEKTPTGCW